MIECDATKELSNAMVVNNSNAPKNTTRVWVCLVFVNVSVSCAIYILEGPPFGPSLCKEYKWALK